MTGLRTLRKFFTPVTVAFLLVLVPQGALKAQQNEKRQLNEIQKKIKSQKEKLAAASRIENSTLDELDRLNRELGKIASDLKAYEKSLEQTRGRIRAVKAEKAVVEKNLDRSRDWMGRKLRAMYKQGRFEEVVLVMEGVENISELVRRWKYLETLAAREQAQIDVYKRDIAALKKKEAELNALFDRYREDMEKIELAEKGLKEKKSRKEKVLVSVRREKESYKRMLRELEDTSRRLLRIIRESELRRYAGDGFRDLKGKLSWPVRGRIAMPYGTQKDPVFKTPVFRNGIYIAAAPGTNAAAIYGGRVVFADWFKGYGRVVVINHGGGYHSLYANLGEIFLKRGDIIKEKAAIGRVGDSGLLNKPALYFEIRYKGKPLNPMQWLKRS